jgi:hypothetical protein
MGFSLCLSLVLAFIVSPLVLLRNARLKVVSTRLAYKMLIDLREILVLEEGIECYNHVLLVSTDLFLAPHVLICVSLRLGLVAVIDVVKYVVLIILIQAAFLLQHFAKIRQLLDLLLDCARNVILKKLRQILKTLKHYK